MLERLEAKARGYQEVLSPAWLPRVAAYCSGAAATAAAAATLLESSAVLPASDAEAAEVASALAAARLEATDDTAGNAARSALWVRHPANTRIDLPRSSTRSIKRLCGAQPW